MHYLRYGGGSRGISITIDGIKSKKIKLRLEKIFKSYNGLSWTSVDILPYNFTYGSVVAYNNDIHILGSPISSNTQNYKYNGLSWSSVNTLPYEFHFKFTPVI